MSDDKTDDETIELQEVKIEAEEKKAENPTPPPSKWNLYRHGWLTFTIMIIYTIMLYGVSTGLSGGNMYVIGAGLFVTGMLVMVHLGYIRDVGDPEKVEDPVNHIGWILWYGVLAVVISFFTVPVVSSSVIHSQDMEIFKDFVAKMKPALLAVFWTCIALYFMVLLSFGYPIKKHCDHLREALKKRATT